MLRMYTGIVVGTVVATVKEESLEGVPFLVVQKLENGRKTSKFIAADQTRQAGPGDFVYLIGSKEASTIFRKKYIPVDASIVGFIDDYHEEL